MYKFGGLEHPTAKIMKELFARYRQDMIECGYDLNDERTNQHLLGRLRTQSYWSAQMDGLFVNSIRFRCIQQMKIDMHKLDLELRVLPRGEVGNFHSRRRMMGWYCGEWEYYGGNFLSSKFIGYPTYKGQYPDWDDLTDQ
jgi:hypothetical protein